MNTYMNILLLSVNGSDSTISASKDKKDDIISVTVGGILGTCAVIILAVVVLLIRYDFAIRLS